MSFITSASEGEGGYVFMPFCLFICLFVSVQDISKSCGRIQMEILWTCWVCHKEELLQFWWRFRMQIRELLNFWSHSSPLRDRAKNDISHVSWKTYRARYVLVDQALQGRGMRSTECPSSSDCESSNAIEEIPNHNYYFFYKIHCDVITRMS